MKSKLIIACSVAFAMASCSEKENATDADAKSATQAAKSTSGVVSGEGNKVSESLDGKTYELKETRFAKKNVSSESDYYLVYYSASW